MEILIGHYHDDADIAKIIAIVIHIMAANPRPKSFRDIVLYHRDSLINLLQWTSYHLNLVGCRFEDVGTPPVCAESTQNDHRNNDGRKPYRKSSNDAEVVAMNLFPIIKRRRLINILVSKERHFSYSRYELLSDRTASMGVTDNPAEQ